MTDESNGYHRRQLRPDSRSRLRRLVKFAAGQADDSAFYGLHRTAYVRNVSFNGYLPPNRGVLTNWCYVFLFDLLLQGRIAYSDSATWFCHNYGAKHYDHAQARSLSDRLRTLLRRINMYGIYISKTTRSAPLLTPFVLGASAFGFFRDIASFILRTSRR